MRTNRKETSANKEVILLPNLTKLLSVFTRLEKKTTNTKVKVYG